MRVLTSFDLWLKPGLTRGILVVLAEKGALGTPVPEQVAPCRSGCSRGPIGRKKNIFGFFGGPACKSRAENIRYQQLCVCVCVLFHFNIQTIAQKL